MVSIHDPQLPQPASPPIEPMPTPKTGKGKLAGTIGATAAAALLALVATWEGKANDPYRDIVHVWTVCYGETNAPMRHYSDAECADMLANSLNGYGKGVLERNPELRARPYQLAAASSLAYNIGLSSYRGSTVARRFSARDWRGGCDAMLRWNRAGGKVVPGLVNRRKAERAVCLTGVK